MERQTIIPTTNQFRPLARIADYRAGPLSKFLYYSKVPAAVLPWLRQPQLYRGKILGSIFTVLAVIVNNPG